MTAPRSTIYRALSAMKADWDDSPEFGKRCAIAVFVMGIPAWIGLVWGR